jgi:electron transfer flavoprotein beta subunit
MKCFVCCKQVPDVESRLKFSDGKLDISEMNLLMNAYDASALEGVLSLRDSGVELQIEVVSVGSESSREVLRKALAMGADSAWLIDSLASDAKTTALLLYSFLKRQQVDLIFCGKQSQDTDGGVVAGYLAEMMGFSFITNVVKVESEQGSLKVFSQRESGVAEYLVSNSVVISCSNDLAEPRIPKLKGIMASKKKPFHTIKDADLKTKPEEGVLCKERVAPPERSDGIIYKDSSEELCVHFMEALESISVIG